MRKSGKTWGVLTGTVLFLFLSGTAEVDETASHRVTVRFRKYTGFRAESVGEPDGASGRTDRQPAPETRLSWGGTGGGKKVTVRPLAASPIQGVRVGFGSPGTTRLSHEQDREIIRTVPAEPGMQVVRYELKPAAANRDTGRSGGVIYTILDSD